MALRGNAIVQDVLRCAEDGLDPVDALTPEEALARIIWLLRRQLPVRDGYEDESGITALTEWAHSEKGSAESVALRTRLEEMRLVSRWETA
jgi:hypothetical protein